MIGRVARNQLRLILRSPVGRLALLLALVAAVLAVATSIRWWGQLRAATTDVEGEIAANDADLARVWRGIASGALTPTDLKTFKGTQSEVVPGLRDPYFVGYHRPVLAELPVGALAGLSLGAALEQPRWFRLTSRPLAPGAAAVARALTRAGLPREAHGRRVATFSKGMRQKVWLVLAFGKDAALLILDEPTTGLDLPSSLELNRLLAEAAADGAGVVVATHGHARAREIASRLVLLADGRIAAELPPVKADVDAIERLLLDRASQAK